MELGTRDSAELDRGFVVERMMVEVAMKLGVGRLCFKRIDRLSPNERVLRLPVEIWSRPVYLQLDGCLS